MNDDIKNHEMQIVNTLGENNNPAGGNVQGNGVFIEWQNGVVIDGVRNGAYVENVLYAAQKRLEFFQASLFACRENAIAITKIQEALLWLGHRRDRRTNEGTINTHTGN